MDTEKKIFSTAIRPACSLDKTFNTKDISCKGDKSAKKRLTVMFTCSATGEKLKPLVIGKANQLQVSYESNKKAWMT